MVSLYQIDLFACSMYKITADGKTMVGCNYDTWNTSPKIWFENAKHPTQYGIAFNGARQLSNNRIAPNSGMNEAGLVFARLAAYHPTQDNPFTDRITISDEFSYLTNILHECADIEEVRKYIEKYDHSRFIEGVFIYIDTSGNYLIVEPYKLIEGNDPYYILSNFCPSITDNQTARKLDRYRNGEDFLKRDEPQSNLAYCSALSDTMSVCRNRNGDGTLLTSIYDIKERKINLFFYHSYDQVVQYDLNQELAKGDHIIDIPEQFPRNKEYERLESYITPFNTPKLKYLLLFTGVILTLFSIILVLSGLLKRHTQISFKSVALPAILNLALTVYLAIILTNKYVYYFDAPFKHHNSSLISGTSYIPFLLLVLFFPFTYYAIKYFKSREIKIWLKAILATNHLIYLVLILSFSYWGLYSVWQ